MKKKNDDIDKILDDIGGVSSITDYTGLIPRGPVDDTEYNNYMGVLKFSPKDIKSKSKKD